MDIEFQQIELLHESQRCYVHRAVRKDNQSPVVLKVLSNSHPSPKEFAWFKREFEVAHRLTFPGVVEARHLLHIQDHWLMELEDFGGDSLERLGIAGNISMEEFLTLIISVAETLGQLHQKQIIHKDINPSNIVMNPKTREVKLIDFGISAVLSQESQGFRNPHVLEGTLAYISPEQTGRMNRSIDNRSDLYSLGVTCYKLLTGQLPFPEKDPLQLVHAHLAKSPTPPHELNATIPPVVSHLVMRLMAKNADERYQSAQGLLADLMVIKERLPAPSVFDLGQSDFSERLRAPQSLYGRETEKRILFDTFERARQGQSEWVLVSGYSGIGKSALVQELYQPVTEARGLFLAGKFDQHQRDIPYSALLQVFQSLLEHILTDDASTLQLWHTEAQAALGPNGKVLLEVLPELELLIGPQPDVPILEAKEAQNRFNFTVQRFLQVFAQPHHPLVVFIDDLQWADQPSLQVIELLLTKLRHLLIVGAYRDNEVTSAHPLMMLLDSMQTRGAAIQNIRLSELDPTDITAMLSDILQRDKERVSSLTTLLYEKSGGNPYFLMELLKTLHAEGLLSYAFSSAQDGSRGRGWQWNKEKIQQRGISDNVVALVMSTFQKLSTETQDTLALSAFLGNHFSLNTLASIAEQTPSQIVARLWPALESGLVVPLDENYKLFYQVEEAEIDVALDAQFKFSHDRVQQAAYQLIAEEKRAEVHLQIGRKLLEETPSVARDEQFFALVAHYNNGRALITAREEQEKLATLNLQAAQKARQSAAYEPALGFIQAGLSLLPSSRWTSLPDLTLSMYITAAELAYLNGELEQMQAWVDEVLECTSDPLDKVAAQEILIQAWLTQAEFSKAVDTMLKALKPLGVEFPQEPGPEDIQAALEFTLTPWLTQDPMELLSLPDMQDPTTLAIMRLLTRANPAAYLSRPALLPLMVCEQVNLSIKHGSAPSSPFAYSFFSILLCGAVGVVEKGDAFSQLALKLSHHPQSQKFQCRSLYVDCTFVGHWTRPLHQVLTPLSDVYQMALEVGDLEFVGYAAFMHSNLRYCAGHNLDDVATMAATYHQAIVEYSQETARTYNNILQTSLYNLRKNPKDPCCIAGDFPNEAALLVALQEAKDRYGEFNYHLFKLQLLVFFQRYDEAYEHVLKGETFFDAAVGNVTVPIFLFYASLAVLGLYEDVEDAKKEEFLARVEASQEKIHGWAQQSPSNFLHGWHLVEAEKARCLGENGQAQQHYEDAIQLSQQHHFPQDMALANELAAAFYQSVGQERLYRYSIRDAHYAYQSWGAQTKVLSLQEKVPALALQESSSMPQSRIASTSITTVDKVSEALDLASVLKASQAISSELRLDRLLNDLMTTIIESGGAELGYLLQKKEEEWCIEAEGHIEQKKREQPRELMLPMSVVHYVIHSKQTLVLNDAMEESRFGKDPYLQQAQPKSIVCLPLLNQGALTGVVYLENNLSTNAFPEERLQLLQMLSTQAAISLENATLVQGLESTVTKRTEELRSTLEQLKAQHDQLKEAQTQLVQSEKMASLGTLVAGIAHEVNNPVNFVFSGGQNLGWRLQELHTLILELAGDDADEEVLALFDEKLAPIRENLSAIAVGTQRIQKIVQALRTFSRLDESNQQHGVIVDGLQLSVSLVAATYQPDVIVETDFQDDPEIDCWPAELNQAFTNVTINACQAIRDKQKKTNDDSPGTLKVTTKLTNDGYVQIEFSDNGCGMSEESLQHIFEPFFTTKEVGQGAGLGLSIAYGIVEKHGGTIDASSTPGSHTTITIKLPV